VGFNTDWLGIQRPVEQRLRTQGWRRGAGGCALVVGAGGTARAAAYAMRDSGLDLLVWNRSPEKVFFLSCPALALSLLSFLLFSTDPSCHPSILLP
jgi:shikimate 5-dehydrogenase